MKTLGKITLLAASLAVVSVPLVHAAAEATAATNDTTATVPAAKHPRQHARMERRAAFRHHLAKKLGLNAEQIAKLKAVREKTRADLKAVRADMRHVLTAEQQAKLDAMRAKRRHPNRG